MSVIAYRTWIMAGLLAALLTVEAQAEQTGSSQPAMPPGQQLEILVKTALIAYNHGNITGNYTVLRDLAAPVFRESNSATRLAETFRDLRQRNIDISPILLFPHKFARAPEIDKDGDLLLRGFFETRPERVEYFLVFRLVRGAWRLLAMQVATKPPPTETADAFSPAVRAGSGPASPQSTARRVLKKGDALIGPNSGASSVN